MDHELAVIGIGDIHKQDLGISVHILKSLEERFTDESIKFINGGVDGRRLFELLQDLIVREIIILDVAERVSKPGDLNYLTITPTESDNLKQLMLVTIEPFKIGYGNKLSLPLLKRYNSILKKIESMIEEMLKRPLVSC
jgi:hydrogenase maturation protease